MPKALAIGCLLLLAGIVEAAGPDYPRDVTQWQEVTVPPHEDRPDYMVWYYASNYSNLGWNVFREGGAVHAGLGTARMPDAGSRLPFTPQVRGFEGAVVSSIAVDDGWLVGSDNGEFGAGLYWFSKDGADSYQISDHQVVAFFSTADGPHAMEGLAHLGLSKGSIIRIVPTTSKWRWQAVSLVPLPGAPEAISVGRDGIWWVTLSNSLAKIGRDRRVDLLLQGAPWGGLNPTSSALSADERKLYIGMRQYVGEVDLATHTLRLLVPSADFINHLAPEVEQRIRSMYAGESHGREPK